MGIRHKYTNEQIKFLKNNINGNSYKYIHKLFNRYFNMSLTEHQIIGTLKRNGLKNNKPNFKTGHIPHNKGMKGFNIGNPTRFEKGHIPKNSKPIGTEKLDIYGYVMIKVAEPKTWKMKHTLLWEQKNGKIPPGHFIIFADRDKRNFSIENLLLVSRRELMIMNKYGLIYNNNEFTKTGKLIADIKLKIFDLKQGGKA
jgi:hypothetical protein